MYTPEDILKFAKIPQIAWPTVILALVCVSLEIFVIRQLYLNSISAWAATIANTIIIYASFTPVHDASHGSVASRPYSFLNTFVGNMAALCFPLPFPAFKHLHLLHHKYTNEAKDPDMWAGIGPTYLLPIRWFTIECKYYGVYLPKLHTRPIAEAVWAILNLVLLIVSIIFLCSNGYGREVFWGWLLPGRIALALLAFFFDYLPHRPHEVPKAVNPYEATSVTSLFGEQTFYLTWPLLHQNYHNIHHLAPYIPFYMYSTVWHGMKTELLTKGTKIKPIL